MLAENKRQERIDSVPRALRIVTIVIVVLGAIGGAITYYLVRDRSSTTIVTALTGGLAFIAGIIMYILQYNKTRRE